MQNPLIAASPKLQGNILQFLNKFPVHQNINARKHTICVRRIDLASRSQVLIEKISAVAPDGFLRVSALDLFQKLCQDRLVLRLKGLTAK